MVNSAQSFVWTDAAIEHLKSLWASGYSCSMIADEMGGGLSRCAIIGKVSRLNLQPRRGVQGAIRKSSRPAGARTRTQTHSDLRHHASVVRAVKRKSAPEPQAPLVISDDATDLAIPQEQRRTLVTLAEGCCHWPVGDPQSADFFFCAAVAKKRGDAWLPYCSAHHARAYNTAGTARSTREAEEREKRSDSNERTRSASSY